MWLSNDYRSSISFLWRQRELKMVCDRSATLVGCWWPSITSTKRTVKKYGYTWRFGLSWIRKKRSSQLCHRLLHRAINFQRNLRKSNRKLRKREGQRGFLYRAADSWYFPLRLAIPKHETSHAVTEVCQRKKQRSDHARSPRWIFNESYNFEWFHNHF